MTTKIKSGLIADNAIVSAHISSGAISSAHLSSIDTDNVSEGSSNLYFTTARARTSLSVTDSGGDGSLAYDNSTGAITYTGPSAAEVRAHISVTDSGGDGSLAYSNGVITYTGPSAAEVRAHLSAGTGVTYSSGAISIGQSVATTASPTFADINVTGNINVTGVLNTVSVIDLDVQDKTITLGAGQNEASSGGSGIVIDGSGASLLWDESNDEFDFNKSINVTGNIAVSGTVDGIDIAARDAILTSTTTTAGAALPKAGGTMTGSLTSNSSIKTTAGIEIASAQPRLLLDRADGSYSWNIYNGDGSGNFPTSTFNIANNAGTAVITALDNGNVGIGTTSPSKVFNVVGGYENTGFYRDYSGAGIGANYVYIGRKDTNGALVEGVRISGGGDDAVAASHTGYFELAINKSGTFIPLLYSSNGTELVVNESSVDLDFRVESNGQSHMLFVDGGNDRVGIGTSNPVEALTVNGNIGIFDGKIYNGAASNSAGVSLPNSTVRIDGFNGITFHSSSTTVGSQTERMRIDSSGKVIIGGTDTANANSSLTIDVNQSSNNARGLHFYGGADVTNKYISIGRTHTAGNQYINSEVRFGTEVGGNGASFLSFATGTANPNETTGNPERMRIDSSGRIGIGVTPKTDWDTGYNAIQIGESSAFFANGSADEVFMSQNARWTSGGWKYNSSGTATLFDMQSGNTRWRRAASGSNDGTISWSDSMFIDTSGKVGIGTTSPAAPLDVKFVDNTNAQRWSYGSSEDNFYLELDTAIPTGGVVTYNFNTKNNGTSYNNNLVLDRGNVGIGESSPDTSLHIKKNQSSANSSIKLENAAGGNNSSFSIDWQLASSGTSAQIKADRTNSPGAGDTDLIFYTSTTGSSLAEQMRIDHEGNITAKNIDVISSGGRLSAYVQDMFHIGSEKSANSRYGFSSARTYVDGGSSNYQGYVFGQETYIPPVFVPYSPHQVYRLSASIYQLTNGTGYSDSRHYLGVVGYDENFSFLSVDAIGTYQYNMASNQQVFAGNALEVDVTIKGWQGSGGSNGNKMDEGVVYIRPLWLANYQRSGGTAVLTGFNIQPAATISDNDSNAGTNY